MPPGVEPALRALMTQTIRVSTRSGHTAYGAPSFAATATTYRARIVDRPGFTRGNTGEDVAYRSIAWIASTGSLHVDDRYLLPDGTSPPVVALERYPDERGAYHHAKLFFGW